MTELIITLAECGDENTTEYAKQAKLSRSNGVGAENFKKEHGIPSVHAFNAMIKLLTAEAEEPYKQLLKEAVIM